MRPQTIQIFLPTGDPSGIRQAEITTRTVRVYDVPRSELRRFAGLSAAHQPGVYFLIGEESDEASVDDRPLLYIGESDDVSVRLGQHGADAAKAFWNRALVAVSLTDSWTKAHTRQLEFDALASAASAASHRLQNGNTGFSRKLQDPIAADCAEYFETIEVLVSTLGHDFLERAKSAGEVGADDTYSITAKGATARGTYSAAGFTVFRGSGANAVVNREAHPRVHSAQGRLLAQGVLEANGDGFVFTRDHTFTSPSGAADVVFGRSANGWTEWKTADRRTLDSQVRVQ
ncbi:GIY-YIG nuclease family protein [Agromyces sp. H66]|uniref:GIY-YIG nuclease family protein n=1 Tax=Agromyces sp. H66 TaxID=2529859 RepID=UPI0010AA4C80|nr:GIY-YIG nuclease family protein [Agromyces sp. H66]